MPPAMTLTTRPVWKDSELEAVRQGVRRKQEIILQLCGGQLGLLEAAARFQAAVRTSRVDRTELQDAEACCRTVIAWVGLVLADRPERAATVTERLEAELELNLARFGCVWLPKPE